MARLVAVSLLQVPIEVRRKAALPLLTAAKKTGGITALRETIELERAIERPSTTRYRLPADAVERVLNA